MAVDIYGREIVNKFICQKDDKIYFVKNFSNELFYNRSIVTIAVETYSLWSHEQIAEKRDSIIKTLTEQFMELQIYGDFDTLDNYLEKNGVNDKNLLWPGENSEKRKEITAIYESLDDEEKQKLKFPSGSVLVFENFSVNSLPTPKIIKTDVNDGKVIKKLIDNNITIFDEELYQKLNRMLYEAKK